jgi:hypothetical protein
MAAKALTMPPNEADANLNIRVCSRRKEATPPISHAQPRPGAVVMLMAHNLQE